MAGLPWFKVDSDLPGHPKSVRLAAKLGNPLAWAYVVRLWSYCAQYQADGQFLGEDATAMVEHASGWTGEPGKLVAALLACGEAGKPGFLEYVEGGGLCAHGWIERNGAHLAKQERDARKPRGKKPRPAPVPRGTEEGRERDERGTEEGRRRDERGTEAETARDASGSRENPARESKRERENKKHITPLPPASGGPEDESNSGEVELTPSMPAAEPPRRSRAARLGPGDPAFEPVTHWLQVVWPKLSTTTPEPVTTAQARRLAEISGRRGPAEVMAAMDRAAASLYWAPKLTLTSFLERFDQFLPRKEAGPQVRPIIDCTRPKDGVT